MPEFTWQKRDQINGILQGLETGQMSRTYAAALLRKFLADDHLERHRELNDPARIALIDG